MASPLGYTTRGNVESFLNRVFSEVSTSEFNNYISSTEAFINNFLGYNAMTTTSGMLQESITREKHQGKIDSHGNLVIDVSHPPIAFDVNNNPQVTLLEFNLGGIRVSLQLTDGTTSGLNTLLEVSENRKKLLYPSLYFFPALSTVTPTAKVNLYSLRDIKFFVDVSYIGGYTTIPADITQAANLLVGDMVLNRDNPKFALSVRQGSYYVDYLPRTAGTGKLENQSIMMARMLLQPYIRNTW